MNRRASRGRPIVLGAVLTLSLGSCHRSFSCREDAQCGRAGNEGRCEAEGFCSFPDDSCDSGRRFGEHAGRGLVGVCLGGPAATTAADADGDGASTSGSSGATSGSDDEGSSSSSSSSSSSGVGPCPSLSESEPLVVDADDTVIERVRIVSDGVPAINVNGHTGVTIRDVEIHHRGAPGIVFAASHGISIINVVIAHADPPPVGPHARGGQAGIDGRDSEDVVIDSVRLSAGSSGIVLDGTPGAQLRMIEGHDVRGPGEAAFVRLHESDDAVLEDFSIVNPLGSGRPASLIQIVSSSNVTVRRGLLDGHNSDFGFGVYFVMTPGQHAGGLVEDVDGVRQTNGAFGCFPYGRDIVFRRTRARDNICEIVEVEIEDCDVPGKNGGCVPSSGGISWAGSLESENIAIEASSYAALCADPVWPQKVFATPPEDLVEEDFVPREPIAITPCWE